MYVKSGFEVIRRLDVDLDAYTPPNEGPDAKWGTCTFRGIGTLAKRVKEKEVGNEKGAVSSSVAKR